jgi:hypothetical protein
VWIFGGGLHSQRATIVGTVRTRRPRRSLAVSRLLK